MFFVSEHELALLVGLFSLTHGLISGCGDIHCVFVCFELPLGGARLGTHFWCFVTVCSVHVWLFLTGRFKYGCWSKGMKKVWYTSMLQYSLHAWQVSFLKTWTISYKKGHTTFTGEVWPKITYFTWHARVYIFFRELAGRQPKQLVAKMEAQEWTGELHLGKFEARVYVSFCIDFFGWVRTANSFSSLLSTRTLSIFSFF